MLIPVPPYRLINTHIRALPPHAHSHACVQTHICIYPRVCSVLPSWNEFSYSEHSHPWPVTLRNFLITLARGRTLVKLHNSQSSSRRAKFYNNFFAEDWFQPKHRAPAVAKFNSLPSQMRYVVPLVSRFQLPGPFSSLWRCVSLNKFSSLEFVLSSFPSFHMYLCEFYWSIT